jgi:hypothetical protein
MIDLGLQVLGLEDGGTPGPEPERLSLSPTVIRREVGLNGCDL